MLRIKWHVEKPNVKSGDTVLVKDKNACKLAQVISASPSFNGRVRNIFFKDIILLNQEENYIIYL